MGLNSPAGYPDLATLQARYERPALRAGLARCSAKSFPEVLAHEVLPPGLLRAGHVAGELHTLRRPILSQHAARAFFSGRGVDLPRFAGGPDTQDTGRPQALLAELLGGGPVPEEIAASVTRHVCAARRVSECAAWLARWRADHPDSVAARRFDPRGLQGMGGLEGISPPMVTRVEQLFRGQVPPEPGADPLRRAANLTSLFSNYYTHAIPFDRSVLREGWSGCDGAGGDASRCRSARVHANAKLDRFELPRAPLAGGS